MKEENKYIDSEGKIWIAKFNNLSCIKYSREFGIIFKELQLWNEEVGWGLWDNGRDLKFIK